MSERYDKPLIDKIRELGDRAKATEFSDPTATRDVICELIDLLEDVAFHADQAWAEALGINDD